MCTISTPANIPLLLQEEEETALQQEHDQHSPVQDDTRQAVQQQWEPVSSK